MKSQIFANAICTFELPGNQPEAQQLVLDRLKKTPGVSGLQISTVRTVLWIDPNANTPRTYERDDEAFHRFTTSFSIYFEIEGGMAEAQSWVLDALNGDDEPFTHMVVQSIDITATETA